MEAVNIGSHPQTTSTHTVSIASNAPAVVSDLVKVKIQYPKDYEGVKHFKDGDIKPASKESAAMFISKGFATMYEPGAIDVEPEEPIEPEAKKKPGKKANSST